MIKVKATISFCGALSMAKNECKEVDENNGVVKDLLRCGYLVPMIMSVDLDNKEDTEQVKEEVEKPKKRGRKAKEK